MTTKRRNPPRLTQTPTETDFAFAVMKNHITYSPVLFPTRDARNSAQRLLNRLKEAHEKATLTAQFDMPGTIDYPSLAHFLRSLWAATSAVFDAGYVQMDDRRVLVGIHLDITSLRDSITAALGSSPFGSKPQRRRTAA